MKRLSSALLPLVLVAPLHLACGLKGVGDFTYTPAAAARGGAACNPTEPILADDVRCPSSCRPSARTPLNVTACSEDRSACDDSSTAARRSKNALCQCPDEYCTRVPDRSPDDFIVTTVEDDLNHADYELMIKGLKGLGGRLYEADQNVTASRLAQYLEEEVSLLYHTGHGWPGAIATADGFVRHTGLTIRVRDTILATCLSLAEPGWRNAFGNGSENILGYIKPSYDRIDDAVVERYVGELAKGSTSAEAWYAANTGIDVLRDRWAVFVREGEDIVSYYAGDNDPTLLSIKDGVTAEDTPRASRGLRIARQLLKDERDPAALFSAGLVMSASGQMTTRVLRDGMLQRNNTSASPNASEAAAVARQWLTTDRGRVPPDAVLSDVIPIWARDSNLESEPAFVGFVVHYGRRVRDLMVRGNGVEDHISIFVDNRGVVAVSAYWPDIDMQETDPVSLRESKSSLLDVRGATLSAIDSIERLTKGASLEIVEAEPVYATSGPSASAEGARIVPAYALHTESGESFVVSAATGKLVHARHSQ